MPPSFKGYSPTYTGLGPEMERLEWRRADGAGLTFIRDGRWLSVYGEHGCAIYSWSTERDLNFIAGCELDYLADRCNTDRTRDALNFVSFHLAALQAAVAHMSGVEPEGVEHG